MGLAVIGGDRRLEALGQGIAGAANVLPQILKERNNQQLINQGMAFINNGNPLQGLSLLQQAYKDNPQGHHYVSQIQQQLGQNPEMLQQQRMMQLADQTRERDEIIDLLKRSGYSDEAAETKGDWWMKATEGGKTQLLQNIIDDVNRMENGPAGKDLESALNPRDPFARLTPKEKAAKEKELRKENIPIYQDLTKKIKNREDELDSLRQLENLKNTGKLNLNWTSQILTDSEGNLRFPSISSPEQQLAQKVIAGWVSRAKDSFGARVTNFDLQSFMKQFPGMRNSPEAWDMITEQMKLIDEINLLHDKAKANVFRSKGLSKVQQEDVDEMVQERIGPKVAELKERFELVPFAPQIKKAKAAARPGQVLVMLPDKSMHYVSQDQAQMAVEQDGAKIL